MKIRLTTSGRTAGPGWTRVTRGAHRRVDSADPATDDLGAWAAVLPPRAAFTHVTGARLLGLWLPPLPRGIPVTVQVPTGTTAPQRPDLRVIRCSRGKGGTEVLGLRVAPVDEVLLTLCRDLGPLDALVAVESALVLGVANLADLERAARARRRGAPLLRALLPLVDVRSESPWETILREFHRCVGAPVTPQFVVRDSVGSFVARADLRVGDTRVLHEYDGHHHLDVDRQRADLRRHRRLVAAGWIRRGYTSDDLLVHPHSVLRDVDDSLGRRHQPGRVAAWTDLLSDSARTRSGRLRLLGRLVPLSGPDPASRSTPQPPRKLSR
ncbi:hypothetical protein IEQ44_03705 [Nocardioides sp. Y6]|uniref:Transcriptional regulator, AbiEi antitoxin, Type IV TA system n=1 Tax=Nocardioides malaquae TaxID=2773426 RepID=A0ABR9RQB8_9ACTN|nr:hypothetical protein [Nocardioides malaquae]MBE7323753.1 hypothetical protein [Nocardioides malaquae]